MSPVTNKGDDGSTEMLSGKNENIKACHSMNRTKIKRFTLRFVLSLVLGLAIYVILLSLIQRKEHGGINYGSVAGGLAVITAVVATFGSIRLAELQEDENRPRPYIYIKTERYQLFQLAVKNVGRETISSANIYWETQMTNDQGEQVFPSSRSYYLPSGEEVSQLVGVAHQVIERYPNPVKGRIFFRDAHGLPFVEFFLIDFGQLQYTLAYDNEQTKAYREIQNIPGVLKEMEKGLSMITEHLKTSVPPLPSSEELKTEL
jgi:hypothetical protein